MVSTTLDGEVRGAAVRTIQQAIDDACGFFAGRTREHLAAHGLADASAQSWYDVRDYVAVYDDLLDSTGKHTVNRIGKELAHRMPFDRDPQTLGEALAALDDSYRHLHRGNVGGYRFESAGAESGRLVCHTPYPAPLERGLVRGLAQRFTDTGFISTELVNTDRQDDFHSTTFDLEWWEGTEIQTGQKGVEAGTPSGLAGAD